MRAGRELRPPPSADAAVAVMIPTRDRPRHLALCLKALAAVERPAGGRLDVIIADNSEAGRRAEIEALAAAAGLSARCVHEPARGYARIRNAALAAVLETPAEVLIFFDDDHAAHPTLVTEYLACFAETGADVVKGAILPRPPERPRTQPEDKIATSNVAFRRWLVDPPETGGAGLAFDPRFNLIGYEDHQFFYDAQEKGAVCVRSNRPFVSDIILDTDEGTVVADPVLFAYAAARNRVYAARVRYGRWRGRFHAARLVVWKLPRAVLALALGLRVRRRDAQPGQERSKLARLDLAAVKGALDGLHRPGLDRAAAKRGELIEVPEPEPPAPVLAPAR